MGTYAEYVLWVGVRSVDLTNRNFPHFFVESVNVECGGVEKEGLLFKPIYMHGRTVGIGVVVQEMSWTVEIDNSNLYHPSVAKKAEKILRKVNGIFKKLEMPSAKIYQHIDLGG